jgi:hypothetical protein
MPAILGQIAFGFELRDGGRIRGMAVGVDHPRRGMVRSAKRFGEKAPSRGPVLSGREKEVEAGALSPVRTSRPCASCHWWVLGSGVSTAAIQAHTAGEA